MSEPMHRKCGGLLEMMFVYRPQRNTNGILETMNAIPMFYHCPFCNEIFARDDEDVELVKYADDEFLWDYVPIGSAVEYKTED